MVVMKIVEICIVRAGKCNGCIYNGKTCEHAKKILKVKKPFEYTHLTNKNKGGQQNGNFKI